MIFTETKLKDAFVIDPLRSEDERGFFARSFCRMEFSEHGLNTSIVQTSISYNRHKGTFRGMHFQSHPFEEDKIVSCIHGAMLDIIVDMRVDSPTFKESISTELSFENGRMLYVPRSFAHGFLTLTSDTQVLYQMTQFYQPDYARGFRFNDPSFNILLPYEPTSISEKDKNYPDLFPMPLLNRENGASHNINE